MAELFQKMNEKDYETLRRYLSSKISKKEMDEFDELFSTCNLALKTEDIKNNKNIPIKKMNIEDIISYKMGQTQINLSKLKNELNAEYKTKKVILFFDEIDSIVLDRNNLNDVGEHSRVISSFIKMLDGLNQNIIVFAATNILDKIDDAVLRRFNLKVIGKKFNGKKFVEYFNNEMSNSNISLRRSNDLFDNELLSSIEFTLSDLKTFEDHINLEINFNDKLDSFIEMILYFNLNNKFDLSFLSKRVKEEINKRGKTWT